MPRPWSILRRSKVSCAWVACLVLSVGLTKAQELEEVGPLPEQGGGADLFLEVFINDQPMNLITRFSDEGDGTLSADAQELRNSGILPDSVAQRGEVRLDQISGLVSEVNVENQTIHFILPPELLAPHMVDATESDGSDASTEGAAAQIDHGYGLVLNYGLSLDAWKRRSGGLDQSFSGTFDTRLFMPIGSLNHGFAITEAEDSDLRYRRLNTYWRSSFPGRAVQLQAGDIATRGPSWSRPVRLGGVVIERNFGMRPDLVTVPLPGFEGSAALPSTVEVFADSIRTYSAEVPAGPFRLDGLPLAGRSGMAQVVVRDITGRETRVDLPFLVSDDLLAKGVMDFAVAAGRPRLGIGTQTDHYGRDSYATATLRFGATEGLTLHAYAEGGKDLALGGIGGTFRLGHRGTASINMAQSQTDGSSGRLIDLSTRLSIGKAQIGARLMKTSGKFVDIAALTAEPDVANPTISAFPQRSMSFNYSIPVGGKIGGNASVFLAATDYLGEPSERSVGAFYSRNIWQDSSVSLSVMSQRGRFDDTVIGASFHIPLGARRSINTSTERSDDGWRHYATASGRSESRYPNWDWRLQASRTDAQVALLGNAGYEGRLGRVELGASASEGNSAVGLRLDGSVVVSGGGIFLSRRIHDAFAVVDAGAAGVEVRADNRPVGVTGRSGKILVPGLRAWEENTLTLDTANLPVDAAVAATSQTVRPAFNAGTRVSFGVSTSAREALVELLDPQGAALEVGGKVVVNGSDDDILVGFDGETYLLGLQDSNLVEVSYPDGRRCSASFDYTDDPGTLSELRGVTCQ